MRLFEASVGDFLRMGTEQPGATSKNGDYAELELLLGCVLMKLSRATLN